MLLPIDPQTHKRDLIYFLDYIFYKIIFQKLWDNLQIGGIYAININKKIYNNILVPLFGEARETLLLKKSSKNEYTEYMYVWQKEKLEL